MNYKALSVCISISILLALLVVPGVDARGISDFHTAVSGVGGNPADNPAIIDPLCIGDTEVARLVLDEEIIIAYNEFNQLRTIDLDRETDSLRELSSIDFQYDDEDSIAVGDVNGDGQEELIWGNDQTGWIHVLTLDYDGLASFNAPFAGHDSVMVADIDWDGREEIIHADVSEDNLVVYRVETFHYDPTQADVTEAARLSYPLRDGDGLAVGDVDGDGFAEIVWIQIGGLEANIINLSTMEGWIPLMVSFSDSDKLAVGDVNGDGTEELIIADVSADRIEVISKELLGVARFDSPFPIGSEDILASGDINRDGLDEIVVGDAGGEQSHGTVYVLDEHGESLYVFNALLRHGDAIALGDAGGDSFQVGAPRRSTAILRNQVMSVVNAPPKHRTDDPEHPGFERGYFYASYVNEQEETTIYSITAISDWTWSSEFKTRWEFEAPALNLATDFSVKHKTGASMQRSGLTEESLTTKCSTTADTEDAVIAVTTVFDVYEYPVIGPPDMLEDLEQPQAIMIWLPQGAPSRGHLDYESPIHNLGDLNSYPYDTSQLINFNVQNVLLDAYFWVSDDEDSEVLTKATLESDEEKRSSFRKTSLEAGTEVSIGLEQLGPEATFSYNFGHDYGSQKINTHKLTISEETSLGLYYEGGVGEDNQEEQEYGVRALWYYDSELGHLVLDYTVHELSEYYRQWPLGLKSTNVIHQLVESPVITGLQPIGSELTEFSHYQTASREIGAPIAIADDVLALAEAKVRVPIHIINSTDIGNLDISVNYDPQVLRPTEVTKGDLSKDSLLEFNVTGDQVNVAVIDTEGISGTGPVAFVDFEVVGDTGDSSVVDINVTGNEIQTLKEVDLGLRNGLVSVTEEVGIKGDCNGDEEIGSVDALMALKMSVGQLGIKLNADMNYDGEITSLDAAEIMRTALQGAAIDHILETQ